MTDSLVLDAHEKVETLQTKMYALRAKEEAIRAEQEKVSAEMREIQSTLQGIDNINRLDRAIARSFMSENPEYKGKCGYILPLGVEYSKINALDPESFPFGGSGWTANGVAYILSKPERTRPTRIVFSGGGALGDDWDVGNSWTCYHDQTGAKLGDYTVVGVVVYGLHGEVVKTVGEVPSTKMAGAVFK